MNDSQGISFDTKTSFKPYRILFVLLGGLAVVVGVSVLIWMPDSPVHASMLTPEERIAAIERVRDDQGGTENKRLKKSQVIEGLTDIRSWLIVLATLLCQSFSDCDRYLWLTSLYSGNPQWWHQCLYVSSLRTAIES